jgi:UPF0716 protein FxsA
VPGTKANMVVKPTVFARSDIMVTGRAGHIMRISGLATLAFLAYPLLELAVIIQVGRQIGLFPTLILILAGVVLGAALVRASGLRMLNGLRADLAAGRMPAGEILGGAMSGLAGLLFMLPGFISDAVGLLLLLPPVQRMVAARFAGHVRVVRTGGGPRTTPDVLDLEADEFERRSDPSSPWRGGDPPALDRR